MRAEETEKRLLLKGCTTDPDQTQLIAKVMNTIAHETPSEKIQREVNILNDIHQCKSGSNETTESYANKLEVEKYVHHTNKITTTDDQKSAMLLIQDANLSPDTLNSVTFPLTAGAAIRKGECTMYLMPVHTSDVCAITAALDVCCAGEEITNCKHALTTVATQIRE